MRCHGNKGQSLLFKLVLMQTVWLLCSAKRKKRARFSRDARKCKKEKRLKEQLFQEGLEAEAKRRRVQFNTVTPEA